MLKRGMRRKVIKRLCEGKIVGGQGSTTPLMKKEVRGRDGGKNAAGNWKKANTKVRKDDEVRRWSGGRKCRVNMKGRRQMEKTGKGENGEWCIEVGRHFSGADVFNDKTPPTGKKFWLGRYMRGWGAADLIKQRKGVARGRKEV